MERITRRIGTTIDFVDGKGYANLPHKEGVSLLFGKLAEYEDLELTPDEIKLFLSDWGMGFIMENRKLKKEVQRLTVENINMVQEKLSELY